MSLGLWSLVGELWKFSWLVPGPVMLIVSTSPEAGPQVPAVSLAWTQITWSPLMAAPALSRARAARKSVQGMVKVTVAEVPEGTVIGVPEPEARTLSTNHSAPAR